MKLVAADGEDRRIRGDGFAAGADSRPLVRQCSELARRAVVRTVGGNAAQSRFDTGNAALRIAALRNDGGVVAPCRYFRTTGRQIDLDRRAAEIGKLFCRLIARVHIAGISDRLRSEEYGERGKRRKASDAENLKRHPESVRLTCGLIARKCARNALMR